MKRLGNLFDLILERDNLRLAVHKALRGKRRKPDARAFLANLETQLQTMDRQLAQGTFPLGRSHQFTIHDPKERLITEPCFAERVLHHAIMNICEPIFERHLIADTFACRVGKGRLKALERARQFSHRFRFFLKIDIRKFFPSIPHETLLSALERLFKDSRLLNLFEQIVRSHEDSARRGLPIGSLTSQHFANFYLGRLDRFVKETLRLKGYVRYMDDCLLWADDKSALKDALSQLEDFLPSRLLLQLKPTPYLNRTQHGLDFLGCRVFPYHMILNRRSRKRFRQMLKGLEKGFQNGEFSPAELQHRGKALLAYVTTRGVSSWQFRHAVLQQFEVSGSRPRTV